MPCTGIVYATAGVVPRTPGTDIGYAANRRRASRPRCALLGAGALRYLATERIGNGTAVVYGAI
eukprot:3906108-Rhodomonas_salina.3